MTLRQWLLAGPTGGPDRRILTLISLILTCCLQGESPETRPVEFRNLTRILGPSFWAGFNTIAPAFRVPEGYDPRLALLNDIGMTLVDLQITGLPPGEELQDLLGWLEMALGSGMN